MAVQTLDSEVISVGKAWDFGQRVLPEAQFSLLLNGHSGYLYI